MGSAIQALRNRPAGHTDEGARQLRWSSGEGLRARSVHSKMFPIFSAVRTRSVQTRSCSLSAAAMRRWVRPAAPGSGLVFGVRGL